MEASNNNQNSNEVKFDILKIDNFINKDHIYKDGETQFQFCSEYNQEGQGEQDPKIDFPKYIAKIKYSKFEYIGILSKNLKKESYGFNRFENGDEYFGQWNKDKKEGYGIYYFKEDNEDTIKQVYIGEFKNNVKSGEGIYFKVTKFGEGKKEGNLMTPLNFTLVIGNFLEDNYIKGIIFCMDEGKKKIYKGKMSKDGEKDDDKAELYEDGNKIFYGKITKNNMVEGRIVIMNDNKKESGYYFSRKGNNSIDDDIDFAYEKGMENDDKYIRKLNELDNTFDVGRIQDLFIDVMKIREKIIGSDNFEYIKKINYDMDIKQELKDQYGKYLYC